MRSDNFSVADFVQRASAFPAGDHEPGGDFAFNPDIVDVLTSRAKTKAAVLIGVRQSRFGANVLLTQRTDNLRTHSGQIAFPGGRIDEADASEEAAALRECEEETGIPASDVEIVGRLPDYLTGSGYRVSPVLAVISPDALLDPNPDEVASVFDVPLGFLMDEANHKIGSRHFQGRERYFYEMPYGERYIWGVTAGILRMMYERLYRE